MSKAQIIRWAVLMLGISACAMAQDDTRSQGTTPSPAFGQQNAPILNPENPPLSGVDEPNLELKTASRSFVSAAIQVGQSADTNTSNAFNSPNVQGVSHVLGAADLQKFWERNDLFLEYLGGAGFGDNPYFARQIQTFGLEGVTRWRTGMASVRDCFNYLPDGTAVSGTAGGLPGYGISTCGVSLGLPGILRIAGTQTGAVGVVPRLGNAAILDVVQALNPRSAVTFIGAFSNSHFYHNNEGLLNGDESTGEAGYSHLIGRHDQIAAVVAYQLFRFPTVSGGEIYNSVLNVRWSHTISGRLSFLGGIGPQYTDIRYGVRTKNWNVAGRATLRYRFERSQLLLSYEKFTSQGSGLLPGADTQVAHVTFRRPLWRTYDLYLDGGYSHNAALELVKGKSTFSTGNAGAVLRKHIGRSFDAFAAYRFNEVWFDSPTTLDIISGTSTQRHIATIGLEWHPRPIRIE